MKKVIVLSIVIMSLCGCGKKEVEHQPKEEVKEESKIKSNASIGDLEFVLVASNIENGTSEYTFEITNKAREAKRINEVHIKAKDSEGNIIVTLFGVIESEIGSGETKELVCSYGGELTGVETFEYELGE